MLHSKIQILRMEQSVSVYKNWQVKIYPSMFYLWCPPERKTHPAKKSSLMDWLQHIFKVHTEINRQDGRVSASWRIQLTPFYLQDLQCPTCSEYYITLVSRVVNNSLLGCITAYTWSWYNLRVQIGILIWRKLYLKQFRRFSCDNMERGISVSVGLLYRISRRASNISSFLWVNLCYWIDEERWGKGI